MHDQPIVVALSGGVDSAVSAALLKKQGRNVRAVFMKNFESFDSAKGSCPWREDQTAAAAVAEHLEIPFETWNFEREYRDSVLTYFFSECASGRTPNPDIVCNREIKFGAFLKRALESGAAGVATGHYARVISRHQRQALFRGVDQDKDQSYFLSSLREDQLRHATFPIGHMKKTGVRSLARAFNLPNADRPDSQGICFIGNVSIRKLLEREVVLTPGPIQTFDGAIVGQHEGLPLYTIGQRRGLRIGGVGVPLYIAEKRVPENAVVVASGNSDPRLYAERLITDRPQWVGDPPIFPWRGLAQIRHLQPPQTVSVNRVHEKLVVTFVNPQRAIAPGQIIAFYSDDCCLGSAAIASAMAERRYANS